MSCYIASANNRIYVAPEQEYAKLNFNIQPQPLAALRLLLRQNVERVVRRDKRGTRTFAGFPQRGRKAAEFELITYMTTWLPEEAEPVYGPLFEAALGGVPIFFDGATVAGTAGGSSIQFTEPHGLQPGQAVAFGSEIRFVSTVVDPSTVILNAPFQITPTVGSSLSRTVTYAPGAELKSCTIFDYWSPETSVQRALVGGAVDQLEISVNSDFHAFVFRGYGAEVIDNRNASDSQAGLAIFPPEPVTSGQQRQLVAGNLGQVWIGAVPQLQVTLTSARIILVNNLDVRNREFGSVVPRCIAAGEREVVLDLELFATTEEAVQGLYDAAVSGSPVSLFVQLGELPGQLCGIYCKSVVLEFPEFLDDEPRLRWRFRSNRAQGIRDDEIFIAFA